MFGVNPFRLLGELSRKGPFLVWEAVQFSLAVSLVDKEAVVALFGLVTDIVFLGNGIRKAHLRLLEGRC